MAPASTQLLALVWIVATYYLCGTLRAAKLLKLGYGAWTLDITIMIKMIKPGARRLRSTICNTINHQHAVAPVSALARAGCSGRPVKIKHALGRREHHGST
jgi:hypothetical protein